MLIFFLCGIVLQFAIAGLFLMLANDMRDGFSFKRNGSIRFVRAGRLSFSYCVRKG